MKLYINEKYDVKYADCPLGGYEISNDIIKMIRHSGTGYVSEDEFEMEIDKDELKEIRDDNEYPNLSKEIDRMLQESDPNLDYVRLSIL